MRIENLKVNEFSKMTAPKLVSSHRQLHYEYVNKEASPAEHLRIEDLHIAVVSAMKNSGVSHVVSDELDATLPEALQNIHVSVYYEAMRYVKANFVSDFAHVVDRIVGKQVLDIGCGIGLAMRILENSGYEVQGLDNSPAAIYYCKNKGLAVRRGDAERLPYSNGSFDTVYSLHLLEHLKNFQHAFKESLRVARHRVIHIVPLGVIPGASHVNIWEDEEAVDKDFSVVCDVKIAKSSFSNAVIEISL